MIRKRDNSWVIGFPRDVCNQLGDSPSFRNHKKSELLNGVSEKLISISTTLWLLVQERRIRAHDIEKNLIFWKLESRDLENNLYREILVEYVQFIHRRMEILPFRLKSRDRYVHFTFPRMFNLRAYFKEEIPLGLVFPRTIKEHSCLWIIYGRRWSPRIGQTFIKLRHTIFNASLFKSW